MTPLLQTKKTNCGQTCVAMLLDISIEEAEKLVGHDGITRPEELFKALDTRYKDAYFCSIYGKIKHRNKKIIRQRIYLCLHRNPENSSQEHWTICYKGAIIDPSGREEKDLWPMVRYWIITDEARERLRENESREQIISE